MSYTHTALACHHVDAQWCHYYQFHSLFQRNGQLRSELQKNFDLHSTQHKIPFQTKSDKCVNKYCLSNSCPPICMCTRQWPRFWTNLQQFYSTTIKCELQLQLRNCHIVAFAKQSHFGKGVQWDDTSAHERSFHAIMCKKTDEKNKRYCEGCKSK